MCGIAGIVGPGSLSRQRESVLQMCASMRHRGPDDEGLYQMESGATLGQTRLSIIDLTCGHQPLCNESGSVWVVLNGEIYNHQELRRELQASGHRFSTSSDTEVLVHLYEDHGIDLLTKLNGMFAFALWDTATETLYLARDHLGIKPLYYILQADRIAFASELKALLDGSDASKDLDLRSISEYLVLGYIPDPHTPFTKIRKLRPGSYLRFRGGTAQEVKYWSTPVALPRLPRPIGELEERLRSLVVDATRLQLRADVPIALFASGGLDSTAIMWAAAEHGVRLDAFLMEFDELTADTPYAQLAARALGMNLITERLSWSEVCALLPRLVWYQDEPLADPAMIPCYLVALQASQHVKVILNGTGGDELFGGYPRYNQCAATPFRFAPVTNRFDGVCERVPAFQKLLAALDYRERYRRRLTVFPEHFATAAVSIDGHPVRDAIYGLFSESEGSDSRAAMMYVDLHLYLPGDLFPLLDRMTMAASLEARVPLLDYRLVEFASSLPGDLKMRNGELKWLLRDALRGRIPDAILDRPKQGFAPPIRQWLGGRLGDIARSIVTGQQSALSQVLPEMLHHLPMEGVARSSTKLWTLLILELWLRVFLFSDDISGISLEELVSTPA